jgi:hypothetical protein
MEKKSLEEIWNQMEQKRLFEKQTVEQKETELYEQRETARKEYLKVMRMYEVISTTNTPAAAAAAGAGGGTKKNYFITTTDTVWLYPIADTEYALVGTTYSYTRNGNTLTFADQNTLIAVYLEIFARTAVTRPGSNPGYTLGVGTILKDLKQELNFKINDQLMVTWRLVEQITNQSDLPVGGNSADGTIGYTTLIENWPDPLPDSGLDLALLIDYNY